MPACGTHNEEVVLTGEDDPVARVLDKDNLYNRVRLIPGTGNDKKIVYIDWNRTD